MLHVTKRHIGRILLDGGFLSQKDLESALREQACSKELLGQVLVRMGIITAEDMRVPLIAQQQLGNRGDAVKLAAGDRQLLGALLVQSGHISNEQLDNAISMQKQSGERLGETFKRLGLLTDTQLTSLLDFQFNQGAVHESPLRLGNLLVATGHISREQLDDALFRQTLSKKKLGDVLVEAGYATPQRITHGVRLQKMLLNAVLAAILSLGISTGVEASTVGLQWDPNSEPDLAGYKVYYSADSSSFDGSIPLDVKNKTSATIINLDPCKAYKFAVTAYNTAGQESPFSDVISIAELSPPTVTITSPENATSVSGTACINVNATDNVAVSRVEFYINNQLLGSVETKPYSYSWDTSLLAPGVYTITAKAYDAAGNTSEAHAAVIRSAQNIPASNLQVAYDTAAAGGGVARLAAAESIPASADADPEFVAHTDREVVISGGYDSAYQSQSGVSVVTGSMKIRSGKLIADGLVLRSTKPTLD